MRASECCWRRHLCSFISGGGFHKSLKFDRNRKSRFRENCNFVIWGSFEGPLFLELVESYSPDTDLGWINSRISDMKKPRPTVQSETLPNPLFLNSRAPKACKSAKISTPSFSPSPYLYHIQNAPGGKISILGSHTISHSKQTFVYVRVSYSERFPR
jgi:hypothetical protein